MGYEKSYHKEKHRYLSEDPIYYYVRAKVARRLYFKGIPVSSKILEYGCGLGQNIFLINNAVGYDVSGFANAFCVSKGIPVIWNLKKLGEKKFDVVLCAEVLEHLENPINALREIKSLLKKGGKLILVLPIDKWNKPNLNDLNKHLYNWNFNTITNLLDVVGFRPIHYQMIRATGFKKLLWSYDLFGFGFYMNLTKLAVWITGSRHIKVIAEKK